MEESLLDVVFIEDEVIERNFFGYKLGSRCKETDFWGRERSVVYRDEYGNVICSAREIHPLFGGSMPYVEFYDKDARPVGRAYVTEEILSGKRKVEYTNHKGERIASAYVDEKKLADAARQRKQTEEDTKIPTQNYEPKTAMILIGMLFLGIAINALLGFLNANAAVICRYGSMITKYLICPLMVVLFCVLCRIRKTFGAQKLFWVMHLLVYTLGFAFVAYIADCFYKGTDPAFLQRIPSEDLAGIIMFLLCFAPTGVLGLFSGLWTLALKKKPGHEERKKVSIRGMTLMKIGNAVLITISMAIMLLSDGYGSGGIGGVLRVVAIWLILAAILGILYAMATLPYKWLSNRFGG